MVRSFFSSLLITAACLPGFASADVRRDLAGLYPEQSPALLARRIAEVDSKEMFFKSFAPYFYLHVRQDFFAQPAWANIQRFQSWCVGDGHPENFGVLLSNENLPLFALNDVDDANPCPLAADTLRFLTGWALVTDADPVGALMPAYLRGLRGERLPAPKAIEKLMADGRDRGLTPKSKWVNSREEFKNQNDLQPVPTVIDPELRHAAVLTAGNGWIVTDTRERINFSGGSGGLHRFLVLLRDGGGHNVLLEFKEIARAATFPLGVQVLDPLTRMRGAWSLEQAPVASHWLGVVSLAGKAFFSRPLWDGNLNLKLKKMSDKQKSEIAVYEANLLGGIHRRGGATADYANAVLALGPNTWSSATEQLRQTIKAAYKELPGTSFRAP